MTKLKKCKVQLTELDKNVLNSLIDRIKQNFAIDLIGQIREAHFEGEKSDFRCDVYFSSIDTRKNIYHRMNLIKANPITFLK